LTHSGAESFSKFQRDDEQVPLSNIQNPGSRSLEFDGQVRTTKLAEPTAVTSVLIPDHGFLIVVKFKDVFWAKGNADLATLTKTCVYHNGCFVLAGFLQRLLDH
jgi:hypothetical protein